MVNVVFNSGTPSMYGIQEVPMWSGSSSRTGHSARWKSLLKILYIAFEISVIDESLSEVYSFLTKTAMV